MPSPGFETSGANSAATVIYSEKIWEDKLLSGDSPKRYGSG